MRKVKWLVQGTHLQSGGDLSIRPLLAVFHVCLPVGLVGAVGGKFRLSVLSHCGGGIMAHWGTLMGCALPTESSNAAVTHVGDSGTECYEPLSSPWICVAFGFGYSLPASQVMKGTNIQALIVELSRAVLADISFETEGWSSYWNPAEGSKWLSCLYFSGSQVSQLRTTATHCLFYFEDLLYIDCLGSNLHFINLLHSASISLPVNWGNNSTSLIRFLCRLNELIFIKELEQYSI